MAKKTLKQRNQEYLEARGWTVHPRSRTKQYIELRHPKRDYSYFLGNAGAVRRGRNVTSSVSVKLDIKDTESKMRKDATGRLVKDALKDSPRPADVPEPEAEQRPDPTKRSHLTQATTRTPPTNALLAEEKQTKKDGAQTATTSPSETSPLSSLLRKSLEQEQNQPPHLIVEARAGTGKTTTLVEALKLLKGAETSIEPSPQQRAVWDQILLSKDRARSVCFVAFNKSIASELQQRVPAGCDAMTMHSLGYKAVTKSLGRQEPNSWVVQDIIAELLGRDLRELRQDPSMLTVLKATEELVGLCKQNLVACDDSKDGWQVNGPWNETLSQLAAYYDVDLNGSRSQVFDLVPRVLERCKSPRGKISFDDMIWLPVVLNLPLFQYDLLLVDEAQDLNRCQQALAKRAGRRLVLVGDPKQAIYGFAGADSKSMSRMTLELGGSAVDPTPSKCIVLPLTVTRRCGKRIVEEAKRYVPDFEAHETNLEGIVRRGQFEHRDPNFINTVADGDFVLCRVNAPLVSLCFRFLKAGRKALIQGRDVAKGLLSTVDKLAKGLTVTAADRHAFAALVGRIDDWQQGEERKEQAKRTPSEARIQALQDRRDCLLCFVNAAEERFTEAANNVKDAGREDECRPIEIGQLVKERIEAVFTDDKVSPGVKLSSVHKAKGLEARRVFLLQPRGVGPRLDKMQEWEKEQERNLLYVAITRAIEELVYVS